MSNTTRLADMERPTQLGSKRLNGEVIPLLSAPVQGNWTSYSRQKIIYLKSKLTGKASSVLKKKKKRCGVTRRQDSPCQRLTLSVGLLCITMVGRDLCECVSHLTLM